MLPHGSQKHISLIADSDSDSEADSPMKQPPSPRLERDRTPVACRLPTGSTSQPMLVGAGAPAAGAVRASWTFHARVPHNAPAPTFLAQLIDSSISLHNVNIYGRMMDSTSDLQQVLLPQTSAQMQPHAEPAGEASLYAHVFFAVLKSFVGPAILYLPHAFANAGLLFAVLALPAIGLLATYSLYLLVLCHISSSDNPSYADLASRAYGNAGRAAVQLCLTTAQLGICTSYYIFIQTNLTDVLAEAGVAAPRQSLLIAMLIPVLTPLACVPSLRHLAVTNILADLLILAGLLLVGYYTSVELVARGGPAPLGPMVAPQWLLFLGTTFFTFEGGALVVPIAATVEKHQKHLFPRIYLHAMLVTVVLFTGFGTICFLSIGTEVKIPVTLSVHTPGYWGSALRLGYSLAVVFTYPLQLLPIVHMLEGAMGSPLSHCTSWPPLLRSIAARALLITTTCALAEAGADKFDHFVSLVGAVCSVPITYILPGIIYLKLSRHLGIYSRIRQAVACVSICVGCFASVASGATTIVSWIEDP